MLFKLPSTRFFLGLLLLSSAAAADVRYVDANLFSGANDGSDWTNAYFGPNGVQAALAASSSGDQIWCADGTYHPTNGTSRSVSIVLKNGVEVYGGFVGTESSLGQRPALGVAPSVLSGDLADNDGSGSVSENSYHVVKGTGTNSSAVLDGFHIRGGNANSGGNNNKGGGILCISNSSPCGCFHCCCCCHLCCGCDILCCESLHCCCGVWTGPSSGGNCSGSTMVRIWTAEGQKLYSLIFISSKSGGK